MTHAKLMRELVDEEALTFRVAGDCMHPVLVRGAKVTVLRENMFWPGDVVAFAREDGQFVVHRFLGYAKKHGAWHVVTKADDASHVDALTPVDDVIGRVAMRNSSFAELKVRAVDRFASLYAFLLAIVHAIRRRFAI